MEKDTAVVETIVDAVEEQQIVEIPLNTLDRIAGGVVASYL